VCPAFDAAAETYDREFDALPGTARIRAIVHDIAQQFFPAGGSILELNCGTGTDAMALADRGFRILATDASPSMIRVANQKLLNRTANKDVEFREMSFDRIATLHGRVFDGVLSNMGGLNCVGDLKPIARALAGLTNPGAHVLATFISDFSLWETIAFLFKLDLRSAFRRLSRNGERTSNHASDTTVYYHSPSCVRHAFSPYFDRTLLIGLNIFTPPPSSTRAYERLKFGMRFLDALDARVSTRPPFNRIGDHFVMVLRRTHSGVSSG